MGSVGLEESAGGGSRSSTVACPHFVITIFSCGRDDIFFVFSLLFCFCSRSQGSTYTAILVCPWGSGAALGWRKVIALDRGGHHG